MTPPSQMAFFSPLRLHAGIALSLLLHGLLITWGWNRVLPTDRFERSDQPALEVRLRRILQHPSSQRHMTMPHQPAEAEPVRPAVRKPRPIAAHPTAPEIEMPSASSAASPSAAERHLNLDAIHNGLGAIVRQIDREKRDTPVGQLQEKPLYASETKSALAHDIASTAHPDCKNRIANTGLLAPLAVLAMTMDGKDRGCKW